MSPDVLVIGGGLIGVNAALALQRRGLSVQVIERAPHERAASKGNAGAFAFSAVEPLAAPGIMARAPKWLMDPLGPLSIPPRYALRIAPWMLRFWRASWRDRHAASIKAQAALMAASRSALEALVAATDGEALLRREGQLQLYDSAAGFRASLSDWEAKRAHGIPFELIEDDPARIATLQPGLNPRFRFAGYIPGWFNVTDPADWLGHLRRAFTDAGGRFLQAEARALEPAADHVRVRSDGETLHAGHVVLAAGAWSHHLARGLGDRLPLETERGYNTTLPDPRVDLRLHLTFCDHGFAVSRIGQGIRVGGAVELGGLTLPPDWRRAEALLAKARGFLPGLQAQGGQQWMGFRPSMPDTLPVIGTSPGCARVIHAFGHGHLGLTQSAGTGQLVADLVTGADPAIDLAPFRADRFAFARIGRNRR